MTDETKAQKLAGRMAHVVNNALESRAFVGDALLPYARAIVKAEEALDKMRRVAGSMNKLDCWIGSECGFQGAAARADDALADLWVLMGDEG